LTSNTYEQEEEKIEVQEIIPEECLIPPEKEDRYIEEEKKL
jgi:hypothetical protein